MTDATADRPLRIFLCHASNDKPAVRDLRRRLTTDGFAPWLDEEDILPGQHWQVEIPRAVRNSDIVLVCLSQHSIGKAGYVQKEIKFALDVADEQPDGTIFLIPLRLEECDVPERLNHLQWVNFYDEGGYARLLRALRKRAVDLNASTAATASTKSVTPASPEARGPAVSNVSGGVTVDADNVTVGNDVVGRDKITQTTQTTFNIHHATIIQSGASVQDIKPTAPAAIENRRMIGDMEFVRVPAGKFLMGSKDDNKLAYDDERPQHTVEIPYDYWLAKYLSTNADFARFVEATQHVTKAEQEGGWSPEKREFVKGFDWRHSLGPKRDLKKKADHPVVQVSWQDVAAYCHWLNATLRGELKDLALRLPTETEWEKAARGEYGNEWPWGNEFDKGKCNSSEGGKGGTTPVGAYSPHGDSPYGAADMAGNVWEWCHSLSEPYPYQANDGREGEADSGSRVLRGGALFDNLRNVRAAYRDSFDSRSRDGLLGFRVVVAPALSQ